MCLENIEFIASINGYEIVRVADFDDPMSGHIQILEGTHVHRDWRFVDNKIPQPYRGDYPTELTAINYARNVAGSFPFYFIRGIS